MKKTFLSLSIAGLLLLPQLASAHSSFVQKEIVEGTSNYLTLQIPHGCGANPTKKVIIEMANGPEVDFAFQRIKPVLSWYKIKTEYGDVVPFESHGLHTTDLREMVIGGISLPTNFVLKAEFRGKAPLLENLPEGDEAKINLKVTQVCTNNEEKDCDSVSVKIIENSEN